MSYLNPEFGQYLTPSDASVFLGADLRTLDEPVRLKWRLRRDDWYFAVAKYYSHIGIAFERVQDSYKYVDIYPNTLIELEDGRTWSAAGKRSDEWRESFLEFFDGIAKEQRQGLVTQDEDEDFVV